VKIGRDLVIKSSEGASFHLMSGAVEELVVTGSELSRIREVDNFDF
jgi:hypothetical protein